MKIRVGIGYDLHKLIEGRPFILGGERLPVSFGPLGHSDGDVLTHAIIDAMLGALNLGDIGKWFPDSDVKYCDARSIDLLRQVIKEVHNLGWTLENMDSIVVLEKPKLAPYINQIVNSLANALNAVPEVVSVKAKTNEGCGEIGKGKALAAWATVLLRQ